MNVGLREGERADEEAPREPEAGLPGGGQPAPILKPQLLQKPVPEDDLQHRSEDLDLDFAPRRDLGQLELPHSHLEGGQNRVLSLLQEHFKN